MAAYLCVFIRFDHYPANHRTNQQGNIPVVVQQGNETCQEYIKSRFENSQRIARIIAVIECGSILIFFFVKIETSYILYMSFGIILSAILLALGKIIGQEVKAV